MWQYNSCMFGQKKIVSLSVSSKYFQPEIRTYCDERNFHINLNSYLTKCVQCSCSSEHSPQAQYMIYIELLIIYDSYPQHYFQPLDIRSLQSYLTQN